MTSSSKQPTILKNRNDLVIKAADKGGATVVWRTDLYQQKKTHDKTS